jgi:hypothetical protein
MMIVSSAYCTCDRPPVMRWGITPLMCPVALAASRIAIRRQP